MKGSEGTKGSAKTEKGATIRLSVTEPKRSDMRLPHAPERFQDFLRRVYRAIVEGEKRHIFLLFAPAYHKSVLKLMSMADTAVRVFAHCAFVFRYRAAGVSAANSAAAPPVCTNTMLPSPSSAPAFNSSIMPAHALPV